jgi:polyhydroxyalkanoate synthesis regulator phasin
MAKNISIPTTDDQWRELLGIKAGRLISSSMWSERSITSGRELGIYLEGDCQFAVVNSLEMNSRIKINFCVFWEPVGSNCKSSFDKQRIAHFISELPSEGFLCELKSTDQLAMWVYKKRFAIQLAKCWVAGQTAPDNPLTKDLEEGLIDQWESDYIWLQTSYYEQLWKLIQQRGRKIIKYLKKKGNYPFNLEREFMEELLKESFDNEYSLLLQDRYIQKNSDIKKLGTLARKGILTTAELERVTALRRQLGGETVLLDQLVEVCCCLGKKDPWIRSHLKIMKAYDDAQGAMLQASACDPKLREHGHGQSFACIDGKIYPNLRKLP